jgi:hypothetical protein
MTAIISTSSCASRFRRADIAMLSTSWTRTVLRNLDAHHRQILLYLFSEQPSVMSLSIIFLIVWIHTIRQFSYCMSSYNKEIAMMKEGSIWGQWFCCCCISVTTCALFLPSECWIDRSATHILAAIGRLLVDSNSQRNEASFLTSPRLLCPTFNHGIFQPSGLSLERRKSNDSMKRKLSHQWITYS